MLRDGSPGTVAAGVCHTDVGMGDMNGVAAPELTVSGTPSTAARVLTFVLCVVSAVTLVGLRVAVKVPSVNLTREGVTVVVFSSLLLGTFVSKALFFLTTLTNTSFGIKYP